MFAKKRRIEKYEKKKSDQKQLEKENKEKEREKQEKLIELQNLICNKIKDGQFKRTYTKLLEGWKDKLVTTKQGNLTKQANYDNYNYDVKKEITYNIINTKLTKTLKYKFNKKELYMIEQQKMHILSKI